MSSEWWVKDKNKHKDKFRKEQIDQVMTEELEEDLDKYVRSPDEPHRGLKELHPKRKWADDQYSMYKDSMGELITSNFPMRFENPDGTRTPPMSEIWHSDSGRYFPSETAQKRDRDSQKPSVLGIADALFSGNKSLADDVKKCRVCQRESYAFLLPWELDSTGAITKNRTQQYWTCQNCEEKGLVKGKKKNLGGGGSTIIYDWDYSGIDKKISKDPQFTTIKPEQTNNYHKAFDMSEGERVSNFLSSIFDWNTKQKRR